MKKITVLIFLILSILIITSCKSTDNYPEVSFYITIEKMPPTIKIENNYDRPMFVAITSIENEPYETIIRVEPYSNRTYEFPKLVDSIISIDISGIYFDSYHNVFRAHIDDLYNKKVVPKADYGWLYVINKDSNDLYFKSFGIYEDLYEILDLSASNFSVEIDADKVIENKYNKANNIIINAVRVDDEIRDNFLFSNKLITGDNFIYKDKINVEIGQTTTVEIQ